MRNLTAPPFPRPDPEDPESYYRPYAEQWARYDRWVELKKEMESLVHEYNDQYLHEEEGDLITKEEWLEAVSRGSFIDYDGCGYPYKDGYCKGTPTYPSDADELPDDATHVMWFNR